MHGQVHDLILLCGDLNAQTGGLSDFLTTDNVRDTFQDCPLQMCYSPDVYLSSNQLDTKSNLHGNLLVDICKTYQLRILNGRFLDDSLGYYSFFSSNGKSTIIILVSTELFYDIMYFNILPPSELSDHCLINAAIKTRSIEKEISSEMNSLPGKFIWSDEKREIYI
jgi:hypothetical protein